MSGKVRFPYLEQIYSFEGVSVNKFAKGGTLLEVLVYETEKLFANPCLHIHTKGGLNQTTSLLLFLLALLPVFSDQTN